MKNSSSLLF